MHTRHASRWWTCCDETCDTTHVERTLDWFPVHLKSQSGNPKVCWRTWLGLYTIGNDAIPEWRRNQVKNQLFVVKPNLAMLVLLLFFGGLLLALRSAFGFLAHSNIAEGYVSKLNQTRHTRIKDYLTYCNPVWIPIVLNLPHVVFF